jgi:hypothetical protein
MKREWPNQGKGSGRRAIASPAPSNHGRAVIKAADTWLRGQKWCPSVYGLMTSSGCSAGWLTCTNSAAKLKHASSTYARRPLNACSQSIVNPPFRLWLGLISHLERVLWRSETAPSKSITFASHDTTDGTGTGIFRQFNRPPTRLYLQFACKSTSYGQSSARCQTTSSMAAKGCSAAYTTGILSQRCMRVCARTVGEADAPFRSVIPQGLRSGPAPGRIATARLEITSAGVITWGNRGLTTGQA